ncbi:uncharacterized protein LOC106763722 [Vigna radiata var. radiata]|uniref:Uncharacterized protein LOC106763722 n=1 Tax=Vigna radiata var. radiata TaxID=3916 RepID=A0A3Q0F2E8_VIGRR|nr:uncharacterized protein LOC106763722 [Vigna radiata var. radiata]
MERRQNSLPTEWMTLAAAARKGLTIGVAFPVEGDGPAGFGSASHVFKLKPPQGLHQGALVVRPMAHHRDRLGVEEAMPCNSEDSSLTFCLIQAWNSEACSLAHTQKILSCSTIDNTLLHIQAFSNRSIINMGRGLSLLIALFHREAGDISCMQ